MLLAHKIALEPTAAQRGISHAPPALRASRGTGALAEWRRQYRAGGKPSDVSLRRELNKLKREQFLWMYDVTKAAVLRRHQADAGLGGKDVPLRRLWFRGWARRQRRPEPRWLGRKLCGDSLWRGTLWRQTSAEFSERISQTNKARRTLPHSALKRRRNCCFVSPGQLT
jgi:hypothetical protein